ncbi:hypothetical protein [Pseudonocardia xishanensis]|uniref:Uncharacterized protein n=1 Tax=Pseudonocardia xishanensis TaxID=630995 RepID=A0ABP8S0J2_9PSEU
MTTDPRDRILDTLREAEALGLGEWDLKVTALPNTTARLRAHLLEQLGPDPAAPYLPSAFGPKFIPTDCTEAEVLAAWALAEIHVPPGHEIPQPFHAERTKDGVLMLLTRGGRYVASPDSVVHLKRVDSELHELADITEGVVTVVTYSGGALISSRTLVDIGEGTDLTADVD